ncbi:MAG: MerR family transcriptional regulator [Alphaproteobacteria bacterium]|nr:MerR family transcriptional regulator [Alphaproteobacteria bacterium]
MSENGAAPSAPPRRPAKAPEAFRTISEVADELDIPAHVLRFWEGKFKEIRPLKRGGGRRYYRPQDVETLKTIRTLLYRQGFTIKGAQKLLRSGARLPSEGESAAEIESAPPAPGTGLTVMQRRRIETTIDELGRLAAMLRAKG